MSITSPVRILVIKLGALGDFIQALGPMKAIRSAHPGDHITLLTTLPYEGLGRDCGYFDDVWVDTRPKWHDLKGWHNLRVRLNRGAFTRVYDLQNNDRTAFYFRLFSPTPEWVGAVRGASHRNASPDRSAGKAFDGHLQTLSKAGIANVQIDKLLWMQGQKDFPGLTPPYVLIVPGGSQKHLQKRWPLPFFSDLCTKIQAAGYQPVILGSAAEHDLGSQILRDVPGTLNLAGTTSLYDLAVLARNAFAAIGNDTGPMHIIGPSGCKSIILFSGISNPKRHAPLGRNIVTIQQDNLNDLKPEIVWKAFTDQVMPP